MPLLKEPFQRSPAIPRIAPFAAFLLLTFAQGWFGESSHYWFYLAKTLVGAWLVWEMRPFVAEMQWAISWEGIVVGVCVCVMWIGIDEFYPHTNEIVQNYIYPFLRKIGLSFLCSESKLEQLWNPNEQFDRGSALVPLFIAVRILGSTFVVPPLEEVFYRSFLYRHIVRVRFLEVPLNRFHPLAFVMTSAIFGFEHSQWLAGILCGFAFQGLVIRKNRLGDAITAHAITNFLLGVWVIWKNAWQFW